MPLGGNPFFNNAVNQSCGSHYFFLRQKDRMLQKEFPEKVWHGVVSDSLS